MSMNNQGRPTAPNASNDCIHPTLTGARGLLQDEALIFELDGWDKTGVDLPKPAQGVVDALAEQGVIAGVAKTRLYPHAGMNDVLIACATEMNTDEDIAAYADALKKVLA